MHYVALMKKPRVIAEMFADQLVPQNRHGASAAVCSPSWRTLICGNEKEFYNQLEKTLNQFAKEIIADTVKSMVDCKTYSLDMGGNHSYTTDIRKLRRLAEEVWPGYRYQSANKLTAEEVLINRVIEEVLKDKE